MFYPLQSSTRYIHNPEITIGKGVVCTGEFTCTQDNNNSNVKIVKEESSELTYKVSVIYHGMNRSRPNWSVKINDQLPSYKGEPLQYFGSKAFVFKPANKEVLEVQETDEHETASLWIDLSKENYPVYRTFEEIEKTNEKIQQLFKKGKLFNLFLDKDAKKVFFDDGVGIFLYARNDNNLDADIYYAKTENDKFDKCEARMKMRCKCPASDTKWEVTLPTESEPCILAFPLSNIVPSDGHGAVSWNNIPLKSISL